MGRILKWLGTLHTLSNIYYPLHSLQHLGRLLFTPMSNKSTQHEKVFRMWIDKQIESPDKWFRGSEFITGDTFVGYKAPARFCELAIEYPELIESRMNGRFREARIRLDNGYARANQMPIAFRNIMLSRLTKPR